MHRTTYNELRIDMAITTTSPLAIHANSLQTTPATVGAGPMNPAPPPITVNGQVPTPLRFVRSIHPETGETSLYIPGGTLKGLLRRAAEQIMRLEGVDCCDMTAPCSDRESVNRAVDVPSTYKALCSGCRLFGSSVMRSHLTVTDAFPADPLPSGIMRDTPTGPVEIVQDETFYATLALKNFERWQVGLLALLFTRINLADVQLGAHRSEGMGCIVVHFRCLTLLYFGSNSPERREALQTRLHGVGALVGSKNPYGFIQPDVSSVPDVPEPGDFQEGLGYTASFIMADPDQEEADNITHALIDNVLTNQALAWASYVRGKKIGARP